MSLNHNLITGSRNNYKIFILSMQMVSLWALYIIIIVNNQLTGLESIKNNMNHDLLNLLCCQLFYYRH